MIPGGRSPLVHIILVNWNGREDTLACLRSLAGIDYTDFRTVLVDNASSDGTVEAVRKEFPSITVIENDKNEMFARANNQGIDLALGEGAEYILLLNNDTEVDPAFLSRLVEASSNDPDTGLVGSKIYFHDSPGLLWYAGGIIDLWKGRIAHRGIREYDRGQYDIREETGYVTACCVLARRECVERIGGLDDGYYMYAEDADWSHRARLAGFKILYEPRSVITHKVSSSTGGQGVAGGMTSFKVHHKVRSNLRFFSRNAMWYHWLTIPLFMGIESIRAALLMIRAGNWPALRAMLTVFLRRKR